MFNNKKVATDNITEDEWIEVEGFKAVDKDMCAFRDKTFQYKMGKNTYDEPIALCQSGLHFSPNLPDLTHFVDIRRARIFKVIGLVNKNQPRPIASFIPPEERKLVAKELTLIEELTSEDIYNAFQEYFEQGQEDYSASISCFADFEAIRFKTVSETETFFTNKYVNLLESHGYSRSFATLFVKTKMFKTKTVQSIYHYLGYSSYPVRYCDLTYLNYAIAYIEEGVSADIRIPLLMQLP